MKTLNALKAMGPYEIQLEVYTGKKVLQHSFFSLDKIVRRKCSIIGRNLLKIRLECFNLNHWHIESHTYIQKLKFNVVQFIS